MDSSGFFSCVALVTILLYALFCSKLQAVNIELLEIRKPFVGLHASCVAQQEFFLISAFDIRIIFCWVPLLVLSDWHL